jgi:hypothetical protein
VPATGNDVVVVDVDRAIVADVRAVAVANVAPITATNVAAIAIANVRAIPTDVRAAASGSRSDSACRSIRDAIAARPRPRPRAGLTNARSSCRLTDAGPARGRR